MVDSRTQTETPYIHAERGKEKPNFGDEEIAKDILHQYLPELKNLKLIGNGDTGLVYLSEDTGHVYKVIFNKLHQGKQWQSYPEPLNSFRVEELQNEQKNDPLLAPYAPTVFDVKGDNAAVILEMEYISFVPGALQEQAEDFKRKEISKLYDFLLQAGLFPRADAEFILDSVSNKVRVLDSAAFFDLDEERKKVLHKALEYHFALTNDPKGIYLF
jgi:hypothetical protein